MGLKSCSFLWLSNIPSYIYVSPLYIPVIFHFIYISHILYPLKTQTQRMYVQPQGEGEGGMNWEIGFDISTVPYVKQIASGKALHSTWRSAQCSVMTQIGGKRQDGSNVQEERTCVYISLIYFVVQQKLSRHCKATTLNFKKKKRVGVGEVKRMNWKVRHK